MSADEVLNAIDSAVRDWTVSPDAMRSMPDEPHAVPVVVPDPETRWTIICPHDLERRITAAVEAAGAVDLYNVVASSAPKGNQVYVFNNQAMAAHMQELRSRLVRTVAHDFFTPATWPIDVGLNLS